MSEIAVNPHAGNTVTTDDVLKLLTEPKVPLVIIDEHMNHNQTEREYREQVSKQLGVKKVVHTLCSPDVPDALTIARVLEILR